MPRIPSLEGTSVQAQRMPDSQVRVQVTPEMLAGPEVAMLKEMGKTADDITDYVVKRQNAKDLDVVSRAETAIKEVEIEHVLAAQKRKGIAADGLLKEEMEFFDNGLQPGDGQPTTEANSRFLQIYQNADERQKAAIDVLRGKRRLVHLKAMGAHEERETTAAALASYDASINADIARATVDPYDEDARRLALTSIDRYSRAIQGITGEDAIVTMERIEKAYSTIHHSTIDMMLANKDYLGAEAYFKKHKKEMRGKTGEIQKRISARRVDIEGDAFGEKAKDLWNAGKVHEAEKLLEGLKPEVEASARAHYNASVQAEKDIRTENLYRANQQFNKAMTDKNPDGSWKYQSFSDLPTGAYDIIRVQPDGVKRIDTFKEQFANRGNPVEPSLASQADTIIKLNGLANGTREEQKKFLETDIQSETLSTDNKIAFSKMQENIANPASKGGQKKSYLAEAIRNSNFDSTDGGHNEVQAQLTMEFHKRVAKAEAGDDKRAPGPLTDQEYQELVNEVFKPGKVAKMKRANSRPAPSTAKIPVVGTPKAQAKNAARFIESIGDDKKWLGAFQENVEAYAQELAKINPNRGQKALHGQVEAYINFAKTNKVWIPDGSTFGDKFGILAQVPKSDQQFVYWEFDDDVQVTYGQVEGVGLPESEARALKTRISSYLAEHSLPSTLENKAKAFRQISAGDKKIQLKQDLLKGQLGNISKRDAYNTISRMTLQDIHDSLEDPKQRDALASRFTKDIFPIIDLIIEEKTNGRN